MVATPLVLVVDDDPFMRDITRIHLEAAGYQVALAESASEGFQKAQSLRPSVVIMDFAMPGGSGADALCLMRTDKEMRAIPVVMVTAWSLEESQLGVKDLAATWLQKPIMGETLIESVRNLLAA